MPHAHHYCPPQCGPVFRMPRKTGATHGGCLPPPSIGRSFVAHKRPVHLMGGWLPALCPAPGKAFRTQRHQSAARTTTVSQHPSIMPHAHHYCPPFCNPPFATPPQRGPVFCDSQKTGASHGRVSFPLWRLGVFVLLFLGMPFMKQYSCNIKPK